MGDPRSPVLACLGSSSLISFGFDDRWRTRKGYGSVGANSTKADYGLAACSAKNIVAVSLALADFAFSHDLRSLLGSRALIGYCDTAFIAGVVTSGMSERYVRLRSLAWRWAKRERLEGVLYTTLSPCPGCLGASLVCHLLVVVGQNRAHPGADINGQAGSASCPQTQPEAVRIRRVFDLPLEKAA